MPVISDGPTARAPASVRDGDGTLHPVTARSEDAEPNIAPAEEESPDASAPPWIPLSRRIAGLGPDPTLYDGVPGHLGPVLRRWILDRRRNNPSAWDELVCQLHLAHLEDVDDYRQIEYLAEEDVLDVVDGILRWWPADELDDTLPGPWDQDQLIHPGPRSKLRELLLSGGSAWRVNADAHALEKRVDETVTAAAAETIRSVGDEAAGHLAAAWRATYGRQPDPDKAYAESVKAVEALACPLLRPGEARATLGRARDQLRDHAIDWEIILPNKNGSSAAVTPIIDMITMLWEGQRSRHAGTPTSRRQHQAEAEAAVHLAATLVQWLHTGVLRKRRTP